MRRSAHRYGMRAVYAPAIIMALVIATASTHEDGPEYIEAFQTELRLDADGGLTVVHTATVHPHGNEIRRGLFITLPDAIGPITDASAQVNQQPVPATRDDGKLIAAAASPLALHTSHRITMRYHARAPWWLSDAGDARLSWQPVIEQFELPWRRATLVATWPTDTPPTTLPAIGRSQGNIWEVRLDGPLSADGVGTAAGPLAFAWPASSWPDGVIRRAEANWPWRIALIGVIVALFTTLHRRWRHIGRDPDIGPVAPRDTPPDGISPAAARYIHRLAIDDTVFVTALVSLRTRGAVDLELDSDGQSARVIRRWTAMGSLPDDEQALMQALFADQDSVALTPDSAGVQQGRRALIGALQQRHRRVHVLPNRRAAVQGLALGAAVVALGITAMVQGISAVMVRDTVMIWMGLGAVACGIVLPLAYFDLYRAPTQAGLAVQRALAGLRSTLTDPQPLGDDARRFVRLLPYAVALDAEQAWRDRFSGLDAGDDDIADVVAWYRQLRNQHETVSALIPILAASSAARATSVGAAGGGASAGGV